MNVYRLRYLMVKSKSNNMGRIIRFLLKLLCVQTLWSSGLSFQFPLSTKKFGFNTSSFDTKNSKFGNPSNTTKKDVIVSLNQPVGPIVQAFSSQRYANREEHVSSMVSTLSGMTRQSQAPVLKMLKGFGVQTQTFWLTNQIFVKNANPLIIQALQQLPMVRSVKESIRIPLTPIIEKLVGRPPNGTEWNVKKVMAEEVWKKGVKGKGIVVGSIDSGVRYTHTTIKKNYVGNKNHGWYDPLLKTENPGDSIGHGTHTVGTMVGRNGIGIAPSAKWMACLGCNSIGCMQHTLIACGQFMLCPSDPNGIKARCTNIPHIINNSWGGPGGQNFYDEVINAWKAAGILAIFASGNSGPKCESAGSPGDHGYPISVGATDKEDRLAKFSSRGPKSMPNASTTGLVAEFYQLLGKKKEESDIISPEICAPGAEINSASNIDDAAYKFLSGTSMASPLVAGAGALLLSVYPKLTQEELRHLLLSTAKQDLPPTGTERCGPQYEDEYPNNMYGFGRLNVYEAYKQLKAVMKERELLVKEENEEEEKDDEDEDN